MSEWIEAAIGAVVGAFASALGLSWRAGKATAEMTNRIDQASKDAESAKIHAVEAAGMVTMRADAIGIRVSSLELKSAVQDERIARMGADLAEIKAILGEVRDRLPQRP